MVERPPQRRSLLRRLAVKILARNRGEVRALADLLELRGLLQFVGIFAFTIIAPGLILAYFGWASIKGEELSVLAEVQQRSDTIADGVITRTGADFIAFERAARSRLESGRSPVESLPELSPHLRVAFRLDGGRTLAAPFNPAEPRQVVDNTFFLTSPWRDALLAEQTGADPLRAAELYAQAAEVARGMSATGQAEFARGRALMKAGQTERARAIFADVVSYFGEARDLHGFRLGDLARLKRGESLLADAEPETGALALKDLVEELLASRWTIGRGAEAAVAARALELIEEYAAKDWLASARGRLEEKSSQLFWAELLVGDLEALTAGGAMMKVSPGEFTYRSVEDRLWATCWWGEDFYAFALDLTGLAERVEKLAAQTGSSEAGLYTSLIRPNQVAPEAALTTRSLAPWMVGWSLSVTPTDPQALRDKQARKRTQRVAVIGLSVFMITTGALLAAWLISRELDVARMKADFAANVSHELRSPITQIRLKGESLMFGLVDDEESQREHYEAIVRESERLSRLVDNVLDFAAIERGAKRYTFRPVDIGETVQSAVDAARFSMELRGMEIEMELSDTLPVVFHDPEAVSQVLHNLISNAAKYGRDGGWIGVTGELTPEAGVKIAISDRGIGIAPEDQARIFEEYYRSNDPRARRQKGTGIGLTIVRYIMEAHGGSVRVESAIGQGTTFTLNFPLKPPDAVGT